MASTVEALWWEFNVFWRARAYLSRAAQIALVDLKGVLDSGENLLSNERGADHICCWVSTAAARQPTCVTSTADIVDVLYLQRVYRLWSTCNIWHSLNMHELKTHQQQS